MNEHSRRTYSAYITALTGSGQAKADTRRTNDQVLTDALFFVGLFALAFQALQIGPAQPSHVWMILAVGIGLLRQKISVTGRELLVFALFAMTLLAATYMQDFGRVKPSEQLLKFLIIYPGFYCLGRWFGKDYVDRKIPAGYIFLYVMLAFQYIVQTLHIPVLYTEVDFAQGALHGSFKERGWLSLYFFIISYGLFLHDRSTRAFILFILLNGAVAVLSGSKTSFVACGIVFLLHGRTSVPLKVLLMVAGAAFYWWLFADAFGSDEIQIRLESERGLAFDYATALLRGNILGYGAGYVEYYFGYVAPFVMGLGLGNNAIFCSPLDFMILAGIAGLLAWLVYFLGLGLGAWTYLLPVAVLSLVNPLNGSEISYLFLGLFISMARKTKVQVEKPLTKTKFVRRRHINVRAV